jgi:alpha-L-arabinofuranosidase
VTTLTHSDIHAHNTFDRRDVVIPQTRELKINGPVIHFPPASVVAVTLELS